MVHKLYDKCISSDLFEMYRYVFLNFFYKNVGSTYDSSLFGRCEGVVHKAKFGYNPNRNTTLDRMIREEKEKNAKEKNVPSKEI